MYEYVYLCTCIICITSVRTCVYYAHTYMHVCIFYYLYVCTYVYSIICMYVCTHIFIRMYAYIYLHLLPSGSDG